MKGYGISWKTVFLCGLFGAVATMGLEYMEHRYSHRTYEDGYNNGSLEQARLILNHFRALGVIDSLREDKDGRFTYVIKER